jgi:hypothetical protein
MGRQKEKTRRTEIGPLSTRIREATFDFLYTIAGILVHFYIVGNLFMWFLDIAFGWDSYFFRAQWAIFVDNLESRVPLVVIEVLVIVVTYWTWGIFYYILDTKEWLQKYKIQPGTNQPLDLVKFRRVIMSKKCYIKLF